MLEELLLGKFWTEEAEMVDELEAAGIEVEDVGYDYLDVVDPDDEDSTLHYRLVRAGKTIAVQ